MHQGRDAMSVLRRCALVSCVGIVAYANGSVGDLFAQTYPVRPVRIVVGFAPGGGADTTARMLAQRLPEQLGQPVVVENRTGASGAIADERVATSPPDGYTLLLMTASEAILPALRKLPYDLERDLAAVSLVAMMTFVVVIHPSVPARNVEELIAIARSQPGKLSYGSAGVGGGAHLAGALFNLMAGVNIVHVPFKGGSESAVATASGQIEMNFLTIPALLPFLEGGRLRPLAVTTGERASIMPWVPTLNESGLTGFNRASWYGLLSPAGVPKEIIARLNSAVEKVVNTAEMKEAFSRQGLEPSTTTPEQFAALIRREITENAKLVKLAGAKDK